MSPRSFYKIYRRTIEGIQSQIFYISHIHQKTIFNLYSFLYIKLPLQSIFAITLFSIYNMRHTIVCLLLFSIFITGCLPTPYYQKVEPIPQNNWQYDFKPTFLFEVKDTFASYQPFFIIRHTQAYPYNNIWIWLSIKAPGDSIVKKEHVNIVLSEPSGKWFGINMGEIYEQRMYLNLSDSIKFNKIGIYKITMEQNMRINPLPDVLHVGLRVEKYLESAKHKKR